MDDLISRQAVLDMAYAYGNGLEPEGYCVDVEDIQALPPALPDKRLEKIADLVEGTIDHFDREDAMELLYQIKEVLNER